MIADAGFGSYETAPEPRENGLDSILSKKVKHSGYPKSSS